MQLYTMVRGVSDGEQQAGSWGGEARPDREDDRVRLGIGLPTYQGNEVAPETVLEFARQAEACGFDAVGVHDRPNHEAWEPLTALAAVATITRRVRLATTALLLPTRAEPLLVKQAALVDRISGGRLDLGLSVGGRADDFEAFDRPYAGRGATFERQLSRLDGLWRTAVASAEWPANPGPAPVQRPRPRTWIGGYVPAAIERAVLYGDGYLFGAAGIAAMRDRIPAIRAAAAAARRSGFEIAGLAYVVPGNDALDLAAAEAILTRYYGTLHRPLAELVHRGDRDTLGEVVATYRSAGLDLLYLVPVSRSPGDVEHLAGLLEIASV